MNCSDSGSDSTANADPINIDKSSASTTDSLVDNWSYQKGILKHIVKKTREKFLSSDKANEFPQCTWFEEDDLLFEDTMAECSANVNDQFFVGCLQQLETTISESCTELNEIVARLISLSEG